MTPSKRSVAARGRRAARKFGSETPRLWTRPLRPLTPETSLGFEVIDFAETFLKIFLFPWQKWLLIHALELLPDGRYRFRNVIVLVARQNGKSLLAAVLAAWWLFVESDRNPERLPPYKFKVLGTAQNLDTARDVWDQVNLWCNPGADPNDDNLVIPLLQARTQKISFTNGKERTTLLNRAHYEIKAASRKGPRGKSAARILMDEMREQTTWDAWNSVSQTKKSIFNSQLWGFSNAGDSHSIVLKAQRDAALADIEEFENYVGAGLVALEEFANTHDTSLGLFEWSAPDDCPLDDVDGLLQANPSCGYGEATIQSLLADRKGMTEAGYRTEVLCQWVTALVDSFIAIGDWRDLQVAVADVVIPQSSRTVWSVDVSFNRKWSWIGAAVYTASGKPFATVRVRRAGMMWVVPYLTELAEKSGHREVVLQSKGVPAREFVEPLRLAGLTVHALEGGDFAIATGRIADRVRDRELVIVEQPDVNFGIEGGVVQHYAENLAWSRQRSHPIDISGVVAITEALYGLEVLEPPPVAPPPPPPPPAGVLEPDGSDALVNLATVQF